MKFSIEFYDKLLNTSDDLLFLSREARANENLVEAAQCIETAEALTKTASFFAVKEMKESTKKSNCCDAKVLWGICSDCREHCE